MRVFFDASERPLRSLICVFIFWKTFLLIAILFSPGPGYDTSTLLVDGNEVSFEVSKTVQNHADGPPPSLYKLLRWDAIYYTRIARRGRLFEQEWAFGYGYTKILSWYTAGLTRFGLTSSRIPESLAGVALSITCHLLSVIVLYKLSQKVYSSKTPSLNLHLSFTAAALHIINPAGAFLIAPYSEAVFSACNFTGCYFFLDGLHQSHYTLKQDLKLLAAGFIFGVATSLRSNGILSGLLFVHAAVANGLEALRHGVTLRAVQKFSFIILGGALIAVGALYPQYVAYSDYCVPSCADDRGRPWCNAWLPSIYGWVQSHYWHSGFLRYWTISNLPLFALAAPMLYILFQSSLWARKQCITFRKEQSSDSENSKGLANVAGDEIFNHTTRSFVLCLASIQAILGIMTFTSAHVQIITRVASGYPLWYWWLGALISGESISGLAPWGGKTSEWILKWMVIYGIVQAGLFASFLPPA